MAGSGLEFSTDYDLTKVACEWQALEDAARPSFFLSWTWISTWLESLSARPVLVRVVGANGLRAAGFLVLARSRRHVIVNSRQVLLHQSGDPDLDRIATEFNGLLIQPGHEEEIVPLVLSGLRSLGQPWDECVLPGVPEMFAAFAKRAGYQPVEDHRAPDFFVDLKRMASDRCDVTSRLSRNGRSQLRRAIRLAASDGPLTLEAAPTLEEAVCYFEALKALDRRQADGAFATAPRDLFHRRLIARGLPLGQVELLRARAGATTIGYLYQFVYRGRVSAYQASYAKPADNRHRPGLVLHHLAIERARNRGHIAYDFLAGEARYKRALGEQGATLVWLRLQQPRPLFMLEGAVRQLKSAFNARMPQACGLGHARQGPPQA